MTVNKPWEDNKYSKRIKRLFFMYLVDIFIKIKNNHDRASYIKDFKHLILDRYIDDVEPKTQQFNKKYVDYNLLFKEIIEQLERIHDLSNTDSDKKEFITFLALINENLQVMLQVFESIDQFTSQEGTFLPSEAYSTSITSLAGGSKYKDKYYRYKNKYMKLLAKHYKD